MSVSPSAPCPVCWLVASWWSVETGHGSASTHGRDSRCFWHRLISTCWRSSKRHAGCKTDFFSIKTQLGRETREARQAEITVGETMGDKQHSSASCNVPWPSGCFIRDAQGQAGNESGTHSRKRKRMSTAKSGEPAIVLEPGVATPYLYVYMYKPLIGELS